MMQTMANVLWAGAARWRVGLRGRPMWVLLAGLAVAALAAAGVSHMPLRTRVGLEVEARSHLTDARVLAIGDSITHQSAPHALCGEEMFNAGVPGDRLDDLLARAPALVRRIRPGRVVVAVGVNDAAYPHGDIAQWREKYRALLQQLAGSRLVLVEVNPVEPGRSADVQEMLDPDFMAQQNAAIRALAAQTGARVVPAPAVAPTRDGLHPTPAGVGLWRARLVAAACR